MLKSEEEIKKIRVACGIAGGVLSEVAKLVREGVSTLELDTFAEEMLIKNGAVPAFKGYRGYKHATCMSVNHEVVHSIPSSYRLQDGDIIGVDIGAKFDGYYGDIAATYPVGKPEKHIKKLLKVTREALYLAISEAMAGNHLGDISYTIQSHAEKNGYSVVRDLFGHGVGKELHEDPLIPNYGKKGTGLLLKEGMVFAIEPMLNEKGHAIEVKPDGWTIVTSDGGRSAHFEHTILITRGKPEILTEV